MVLKNLIKISLVASTSLMLIGCGGGDNTSDTTQEAENFKLSVFHLNDTHSHIDSEQLSFYTTDGVKTYYDAGGYPRIVTKLKELRTQKPNSLMLEAGDTFQGTLYYSLFKGDADADAINLLGVDAYVLGNHEFDDGDAALKTFINKLDSNISMLSANVIPQAGNILEDMWKPYVIKEIDGEKIGIIGITTSQKTQDSSNPSDTLDFADELITAQSNIDMLINQNVNKIILLTHQGYQNDIAMAQQLSGVDAIIGGDSHTYLGDFGEFATSSGEYPTEVKNADGDTVCIAQAGQYAKILGDLELEFDVKGIVQSCGGEPLLLVGDTFLQQDVDGNKVEVNATEKEKILDIVNSKNIAIVAEDTTALSVIQKYKDQVDAKKAETIGVSAEELAHIRIPGSDYGDVNGSTLPLGSEIAPIVAKSFYELSNRADVCIQNAGGVRITVPEGNITMGTAYELLPFANTLFEIEMKGSEIKQVLEDALTNYLDNGGSTGSFPYAYALRYDINEGNPANSRISNLEIKNRETGRWSAIEDTTMYVVVTNSYIAAGKDGYTTFATVQEERGAGVDTYLDYAMSFVRYVEKLQAEGKKVEKLPLTEHCIKNFNAVLSKISSFDTSLEGGSEIVAYDTDSKRMFTTNGAENKLDIISLSDVNNPILVKQVDLSSFGTGVNSVSVHNGKVAVAMQDGNDTVGTKQLQGRIVFFNTDGIYDKNVTVGYLPDMVTFNEDGSKVIVANEGEPSSVNGSTDYYDPIGSVGVITVSDGTYVDINFSAATLTSAEDGTPVRLGGTPSNDQAKDIEPEYVTVSGNFAYVTLQENNAIAKIDLTTNKIEYVKSLGAKSWDVDSNNTIDIEEEGKIKMQSYTGLYGLYMPDTIASLTYNNATYLLTANEGDGREYGDFTDESKVSKLDLDSSIANAYEDENDIKVVVDMGDTDGDGDYDKLYAYGARSFSIWDDNGDIVYDSADSIGKSIALYEPQLFNQDEGEMDGRSGNKGGEPEALTTGVVDGKTYAFVGLERQSAILVYDISDINDVKFLTYYRAEIEGDISPEGMKFIPATDSPNGKNLLLVSYEFSGSTAIYEVK
ncbi:NAD nucleotidase [Sulfurimonas sp.]|uniref:NAD nucleotidase n=1 Tax=Sulfurimonas sp. TaxID=2022749 RepID=UPI00261F82C6|nr:NAD nucleotidase [Sulfurimonas sp.]